MAKGKAADIADYVLAYAALSGCPTWPWQDQVDQVTSEQLNQDAFCFRSLL